jgi:hypothetical protein
MQAFSEAVFEVSVMRLEIMSIIAMGLGGLYHGYRQTRNLHGREVVVHAQFAQGGFGFLDLFLGDAALGGCLNAQLQL